ncbi:MAG: ATP-binding protein [Anaerolineae bacterium]|nr:ATP-binding protein [Anaerolineae bacterium]
MPSIWPVALGYSPWIEEVWLNYLSNAITYGGQPPHLELGATERGDGLVSFWVRNNGPGLTPEEQAKLFTPFTRLNQVQTQGHGLGLSIARRIVEKLEGEVSVESKPGQGSVFSFTLPKNLPTDRSPINIQSQRPPCKQDSMSLGYPAASAQSDVTSLTEVARSYPAQPVTMASRAMNAGEADLIEVNLITAEIRNVVSANPGFYP